MIFRFKIQKNKDENTATTFTSIAKQSS